MGENLLRFEMDDRKPKPLKCLRKEILKSDLNNEIDIASAGSLVLPQGR